MQTQNSSIAMVVEVGWAIREFVFVFKTANTSTVIIAAKDLQDRIIPKATTRNCSHQFGLRARRDSNSRPPGSKPGTLSS